MVTATQVAMRYLSENKEAYADIVNTLFGDNVNPDDLNGVDRYLISETYEYIIGMATTGGMVHPREPINWIMPMETDECCYSIMVVAPDSKGDPQAELSLFEWLVSMINAQDDLYGGNAKPLKVGFLYLGREDWTPEMKVPYFEEHIMKPCKLSEYKLTSHLKELFEAIDKQELEDFIADAEDDDLHYLAESILVSIMFGED